MFSLWCFTQFGVLINPIALKVVGPLLLYSNSSMDGTNPPFPFPNPYMETHKQENKGTRNKQRPKMK